MGATYTRQSSSAIVDGGVIEASDINAEFDQVLAAFAVTSGHTHDGTAAEGGPVTKLLGTAITIGDATAGTDIAVTFDGETADGVLTWMEDEDYFKFSDEVLMNSTEKLLFGDTGTYIHQSADGVLDLVSDTEIEINATTIDINGAVAMDGAITGATNITLSGELDAATLDISGNADIDGTLEADAITIGSTAIGSIYGAIAGSSSIVTTGALDSGSITSGFGTIDTGSSTITTTGLISGGSLDIDNVLINGTTIGHTDDTDLLTVADGIVTVAGEISVTTLDIGGTNVTSDATELNLLDGKAATNLALTGIQGGTNFTGSTIVGHATTGTLNNATYNTGVGIFTLEDITSGDYNSAFGNGSLKQLTTGVSNTAYGTSSLQNNVSGNYNTAVGTSSGQLVTGASNITLGYQAGDNITSGDGNVIIGSINADSATGDKQLILADGVDGSVAWLKGDSSGNLTFKSKDTGDDNPYVLTLQTGETDIAASDVLGSINFQAPDEGTGTDAILVAAGIAAVSEGDFSSSSNATKLSFKTAASEAAAEKMSLSSAGHLTVSGGIYPSGDIGILDGKSIYFGNNNDVRVQHVHNEGIILKHTATADNSTVKFTLQTGETDIAVNDVIGAVNFQAPAEAAGTDAILVAAGIEAVSEGDFAADNNATKLSFKTAASEAAAEKMSLSSGGNLTVSGDISADNWKQEGTGFGSSILIGHATTGTLSNATSNTGVGIGALDALTSGTENVAIGQNSGSGNASGIKNTFLGRAAGFNATGSSNTLVGRNAGVSINSGASNITLGTDSGDNITSGDGNVIIGSIDADSATGDKQLIVADGVDGSVAWLKGDSSGNLTTIGDVTLANDKKVIFGDAGENIVGDGTNFTVASSNNFTLDAGNDVFLDAGNGNIYIQDDGTIYGHISKSGTTDFQIKSYVSDKDFKILGNDGGSQITALTFDMSEAGAATFNDKVIAEGGQLTTTGKALVMGF